MQSASPLTKVHSTFADDLNAYMKSHREQDYLLIDVREPIEYELGHIPGAKPIPLGRFEARISELDSDREVLLYCAGGARSRVATAMLAASGLTPRAIFNVEGGFSAWDGKPLQDLPRVKAFDGLTGLPQILTAAMNLEKGAWRFYAALLDRHPSSPFAQTAATLVKLEREHARVVHRLLSRYSGGSALTDFDQMFAELSGDILESGEALEPALARAESLALQPCVAFAELALDIEYHAYELYRALSEQNRDPEEKGAFLTLAEQEKGHIRLIAGRLEDCFEQ